MARVVVAVKPGSKRPGLSLRGDEIEIRVGAPAREGEANDAVRRALAEAAGVPPSDVTLVRGAAARLKAFEVAGLTLDDLRRRLLAAAERG